MEFAIVVTISLFIHITNGASSSCNEDTCGSVVSKCMLTQSCKCDGRANITCSKDCFYCLGHLFSECCTCVEICPDPNNSENLLNKKSHVEDLPDTLAELFNALTTEEEDRSRWTTYTFPMQLSFPGDVDKEIKIISAKAGTETNASESVVNCTVAYMTPCMSWNKCKGTCASMGAESYRWFHDGCCECVGSTCINYGINESRCLECFLNEDPNLEEQINENEINTPEEKPVEEDTTADETMDDDGLLDTDDEEELGDMQNIDY